MANDLSIDLNLKNLRSNQTVGKVGGSPQSPEGQKIKKSLGDPMPQRADIREFPEPLRQAYAYGGVLGMLERKLNGLTGEKYKVVPARGDRVCIDEKGLVYVGGDFMAEHLDQHAVVAGVLSHEWGHFPTRRILPNLDPLPWKAIYRLRREEETKADMFCGRALYLLGYHFQPLLNYLKRHESPEQKTEKYHSFSSRAKVIVESYRSQAKRNQMAGNIQLSDAVYGDPIHTSKLIGS